MKEITIPFGPIADDNRAEVEVRIPSTGEVWRYRIESVPVRLRHKEEDTLTDEVEILQSYIRSYNQDWELIQIFEFNERTGFIRMLYREKLAG
jgi:hypothetical protein